jgi:hypothetical protein
MSNIAAERVSSEGAVSSKDLGRFRNGNFVFVAGVAGVGMTATEPFCTLEGNDADVDILNFGPCFEEDGDSD